MPHVAETLYSHGAFSHGSTLHHAILTCNPPWISMRTVSPELVDWGDPGDLVRQRRKA
jgi:hypothetical protein